MYRKLEFYEEYGVEEYYLYDPDHNDLEGWLRDEEGLSEIRDMNGWTSPRLEVRFDTSGPELRIYGPDGRRFLELSRTRGRQRTGRARPRTAQSKTVIVLRTIARPPNSASSAWPRRCERGYRTGCINCRR